MKSKNFLDYKFDLGYCIIVFCFSMMVKLIIS